MSINQKVLHVLQHGINRDSRDVLTVALAGRCESRQQRVYGTSFETSLGLGCVPYAELDGNGRSSAT